jgi:glycosyltransferase involved in cell wall biosynthesis
MHNAVNLERFSSPQPEDVRQLVRSALGLPPQAILIGTIGRLTRQKGYSVLLQAASAVLKEIPDAHVVIVGEGELRDSLESLAEQLGVGHAVHLLGARHDIEELLAATDLFVSSSLWEGLPTVILEAMASGVPVVATDVSGTRELVRDGVTGRLVPAGEAAPLAQAIVNTLQDLEQMQEMVNGARILVQEFSIEQVARQHVEAYSTLLTTQ